MSQIIINIINMNQNIVFQIYNENWPLTRTENVYQNSKLEMLKWVPGCSAVAAQLESRDTRPREGVFSNRTLSMCTT